MKLKSVAVLAALILTVGLATACHHNEPESHEGHTQNSVKVDADVNKAKLGAAAPQLGGSVTMEGNTAVVSFVVSNMTLSPEHYGKKHVPGEGHVHVSVDGVYKESVKHQVPIRIQNLTPGKHTVTLEVQQNDHTSYNVQKVFNLEVKK